MVALVHRLSAMGKDSMSQLTLTSIVRLVSTMYVLFCFIDPSDVVVESLFYSMDLLLAFTILQICVNWDYTPSRELTAMVYPLFEYSLLIYIFLDFVNSAISYKKGYVSARYWTIAKIFFPIQVVLCAWFRMIFVVLAYVNVNGHTAGFLGLQVALAMVAISNVMYILETKPTYGFLGGAKGTRIAALVYLFGDLGIIAIKILLTVNIVISGSYPIWSTAPSGVPGYNIAEIVDVIWMLFNAVLPMFISYVRAKSEKALVFEIDLPLPDSLFETETTT
jgi:hypothetical protein